MRKVNRLQTKSYFEQKNPYLLAIAVFEFLFVTTRWRYEADDLRILSSNRLTLGLQREHNTKRMV